MRTCTRIAIALAATIGLAGATLPATASSAATPQWTTLKEAPAPVSNPMKGFMPWAPEDGSAPGTVANALPYTLEWASFPVNTVVTGRDTYNFTKVDALLDAIASRGHQAVIRFVLDTPGNKTGMPHYLIDAGTDTSRTYDFYDNKKISFSPNYNDPKVQEMLLHFVAALGDKYDGDPRIGYITAGLYGFWGEEHTYPYSGYVNDQNPTAINWMPSDAFRARLVEAWDEAFDDTFIQNRYPTAATKAHGMGYFDDSLGYATLEGTSWHFIPKLKEQGEGDAWHHSPIGGELYPPFQECAFSQPLRCPGRESGRDYKALESIQGAHATWLINQKAFTVGYTGDDLTRAQQASAAMGYTLQATRTSATYHGAKATVAVDIKNTGSAPFYATWPLEVVLVDTKGAIVATQTLESPLPSVLPGQTGTVTARFTLPSEYRANDSARELTSAIRVVNPLPGGVPVAFANATMDKPLPGYLGLTQLTRGRAPKD